MLLQVGRLREKLEWPLDHTPIACFSLLIFAFRISAHAFRPYPLDLPGMARAEQNPEDWWQALALAIGSSRADC